MGCGSSKTVEVAANNILVIQLEGSSSSKPDDVAAKNKHVIQLEGSSSSKPDDVAAKNKHVKQSDCSGSSKPDDVAAKNIHVIQSDHLETINYQSNTGVPPLTPPRRKKTDLIPDVSALKHIDLHVKNTPNSVTDSVDMLANYLSSKCSNDLEKIRAIFCWLAYNIDYDVQGYFSDSEGPQDASSVLRSRKSVCQGYSELCLDLCNAMSVPCVLVSGISKGYGYKLGEVMTENTKADHAWNVVLVQKEWRPMDCTWGAGHLGEDKLYKREFNEFWFLTDPAEFLLRHFPYMKGNLKESRVYQLVPQPIDLAQYSVLLSPEPHAFRMGIQFVSHKENIIDVKEEVTIKFKATLKSLDSVIAKLFDDTGGSVKDSMLVSLPDENTCEIFVRPLKMTNYTLTIYGRAKGDQGEINHSLVEYLIRCKKTKANAEPFPEKNNAWGFQYPLATECGIKKVQGAVFTFSAKDGQVNIPVSLCRPTQMSMKMQHALDMQQDLTDFTFITFDKEEAIISARLPRSGYYKLTVFASRPQEKNGSLPCVGDLLIYADKPYANCLPFPSVYNFAGDHCARLLQPLHRQVARDVKTLFRVLAPSLQYLQAEDTAMELKNDGVWEAEVTPSNGTLTIYGAVAKDASSLSGLYKFDVK